MNLSDALLALDAESDWTEKDVAAPDGEVLVFTRFILRLLNKVREAIPVVSHCYAAFVGFQTGVFKPIAAVGRNLDGITPTPTALSDKSTLVAEMIDSSDAIVLRRNAPDSGKFCGDQAAKTKLIIKLDAYGEFIGFLSLDSSAEDAYDGSVLLDIRASLPLLTRVCADAVFSMRVRKLANPRFLEHKPVNWDRFYEHVCQLAALGFGADGAVLRLHDTADGSLEVKGLYGLVHDDQLAGGNISERICRQVVSSPQEEAWTVGIAGTATSPRRFLGLEVSESDEAQLNTLGIHAYMIIALLVGPDGLLSRQGTLAVFQRRHRLFSWRDLGLFRAFCKVVGDSITLLRINEQLDRNNAELELLTLELKIQGNMTTRAEVVALLAHDLGHRAIAIKDAFEQFLDEAKKVIRDGRPYGALQSKADGVLWSCGDLSSEVNKIMLLARSVDEPDGEFSAAECVREIEATLRHAMERKKMTLRCGIPENLMLYGQKNVFLQALFNLAINSIDAQVSRSQIRTNAIHISGAVEERGPKRYLIIKFWDEGTGINRRRFPDPQMIFKLGETSKPPGKGTGTGLPVSRELLSRYFGAELILEDAATALFRLEIPMRTPKKGRQ